MNETVKLLLKLRRELAEAEEYIKREEARSAMREEYIKREEARSAMRKKIYCLWGDIICDALSKKLKTAVSDDEAPETEE